MILAGMMGRTVRGEVYNGLPGGTVATAVVVGCSVEIVGYSGSAYTIVWGLITKDDKTQVLVGFKAAGLTVLKEPGGL